MTTATLTKGDTDLELAYGSEVSPLSSWWETRHSVVDSAGEVTESCTAWQGAEEGVTLGLAWTPKTPKSILPLTVTHCFRKGHTHFNKATYQIMQCPVSLWGPFLFKPLQPVTPALRDLIPLASMCSHTRICAGPLHT